MNIVLIENQFNINNIYFGEPIQNTVMENSKFIKILYSTEDIILNGIQYLLTFKNITKELYFKKIKISYDVNTHNTMIENLDFIEKSILDKYICNKLPKRILAPLFRDGFIKLFPNSENDITSNSNNINHNFILKISGVWENADEYGITYKITFI